jgi:adenylate cyclase
MDGVEIERRFLVDGRGPRPWLDSNEGVVPMMQVYLPDGCLEVEPARGALVANGRLLAEGVDVGMMDRIRARKDWAVRLRQEGERGTLTLKGPREGAIAPEEELEVPVHLVRRYLDDMSLPMLMKIRYLWRGPDDHLWEVDEFEGPLAGLIVAEVKLEHEDEQVDLPQFVGLEVTHAGYAWSSYGLARLMMDGRR